VISPTRTNYEGTRYIRDTEGFKDLVIFLKESPSMSTALREVYDLLNQNPKNQQVLKWSEEAYREILKQLENTTVVAANVGKAKELLTYLRKRQINSVYPGLKRAFTPLIRQKLF